MKTKQEPQKTRVSLLPLFDFSFFISSASPRSTRTHEITGQHQHKTTPTAYNSTAKHRHFQTLLSRPSAPSARHTQVILLHRNCHPDQSAHRPDVVNLRARPRTLGRVLVRVHHKQSRTPVHTQSTLLHLHTRPPSLPAHCTSGA